MNLHLYKIKRQNAFDYSLLAEFMKKKKGKLIFTAGFGNAGKIKDNTQKGKLNLMEKFERNFQFKSIIRSYNEAFRIHQKLSEKYSSPEKIQKMKRVLYLPNLNKNVLNFQDQKLTPITTYNKLYKNKNYLKKSLISFKPNTSVYGKNTSSFFMINNDNNNKNEDDNSVDYNHYFYNTIDHFPLGNNTSWGKDFKIRNKTLVKNISEDCIYLFGKNKIIVKNKNESRNHINNLGQESESQKTPFIDYNKEFNAKKTKRKLKKNFDFYKDKNKPFENFFEMKQDYIFKIRKMFEKNKIVKYKYENLPSHKSITDIVRKNKIVLFNKK